MNLEEIGDVEPFMNWEKLPLKTKWLRLSCAVYDGRNSIYITGGVQLNPTHEWNLFDTAAQKFVKISSLNNPRTCHSGYYCTKSSYLYVFSGSYSEKLVRSIERLNTKQPQSPWELIKLDFDQTMIMCHSMVVQPNKAEDHTQFVIFGGNTGEDSASSSLPSIVSIFEDAKEKWIIGQLHSIEVWMETEETFSNRCTNSWSEVEFPESYICNTIILYLLKFIYVNLVQN